MLQKELEPISIVSERCKLVVFLHAKCAFRTVFTILNNILGYKMKVGDTNWLYQYNPSKHATFRKIFVVRNTYSRIISAFVNGYLEIGNKNNPSSDVKSISFHDFLKNIYKNENVGGNVHFVAQNFPSNVYIDIITLIDDIENALKLELLKCNDTITPDEWYLINNSFDKKLGAVDQSKKLPDGISDISSFTYDNMMQYGFTNDVPNYKYFYNNEIRNLVYKLYQSEIDFFQFKFPYDDNYDHENACINVINNLKYPLNTNNYLIYPVHISLAQKLAAANCTGTQI